MNYWLMATGATIHLSDMKPPLKGLPVEYPVWREDRIKINDRVYLLMGSLGVFAWGYVNKIESHVHPDSKKEMQKVTIPANDVREDFALLSSIAETPELEDVMSKFEGNFVLLTPKMVNALHRLMRMSGGQCPPDAEELEDRFGKFGFRDDTSFQPKLTAAIEKSDRASVLFLDLDNFKYVNDEHGHKTGDDVIREALRAVEKVVGSQGELFHRSGDEMIVLLPNLNKSVAQAVAESIRVTIEQTNFPVVGQGRITTTIGLASFPDTCARWEELLTIADQAAMRAKKTTKNRIVSNLD